MAKVRNVRNAGVFRRCVTESETVERKGRREGTPLTERDRSERGTPWRNAGDWERPEQERRMRLRERNGVTVGERAVKERRWLRETGARERDATEREGRCNCWWEREEGVTVGKNQKLYRYSALKIEFINLGFHFFLKIMEIVITIVEFHLG